MKSLLNSVAFILVSLLVSCVHHQASGGDQSPAGQLSEDERFKLGNLIASYFSPERVRKVDQAKFDREKEFSQDDCLNSLQVFISESHDDGFSVTYGVGDFMIFARAFNQKTNEENFESRHLLLWPKNDPRFKEMNPIFSKSDCSLYGQSFYASRF